MYGFERRKVEDIWIVWEQGRSCNFMAIHSSASSTTPYFRTSIRFYVYGAYNRVEQSAVPYRGLGTTCTSVGFDPGPLSVRFGHLGTLSAWPPPPRPGWKELTSGLMFTADMWSNRLLKKLTTFEARESSGVLAAGGQGAGHFLQMPSHSTWLWIYSSPVSHDHPLRFLSNMARLPAILSALAICFHLPTVEPWFREICTL